MCCTHIFLPSFLPLAKMACRVQMIKFLYGDSNFTTSRRMDSQSEPEHLIYIQIYIYIYMPSGLSFQTSQYNPFAPNHKHLTSWAQSACCDRSWVCVFILAVKKTQKLFVKLYINFANLIPLCCSLPALETIFSQWLGRTHLQDSKSEHHWRSPLA